MLKIWIFKFAKNAETKLNFLGICFSPKLTFFPDFQTGMRKHRYTVISGSIFSVWSRIEHYCLTDHQFKRIQMIRVRASDGSRIVGVLLPENHVQNIIQEFENENEELVKEIAIKRESIKIEPNGDAVKIEPKQEGDAVKIEPKQEASVKNETIKKEPKEDEPVNSQTTKKGAIKKVPVKKPAIKKEATKKEPAKKRTIKKEPLNESSESESSDDDEAY